MLKPAACIVIVMRRGMSTAAAAATQANIRTWVCAMNMPCGLFPPRRPSPARRRSRLLPALVLDSVVFGQSHDAVQILLCHVPADSQIHVFAAFATRRSVMACSPTGSPLVHKALSHNGVAALFSPPTNSTSPPTCVRLRIQLPPPGRSPTARPGDVRGGCLRDIQCHRNSLAVNRFVVSMLLTLGLAACDEDAHMCFDKELKHATGLLVMRPAGFQEDSTPTGFTLTEAGDLRFPRRIELSFEQAAPLGSEAWRAVRFQIEPRGEGSGGSEYQLVAVKPAPGGGIVMHAPPSRKRVSRPLPPSGRPCRRRPYSTLLPVADRGRRAGTPKPSSRTPRALRRISGLFAQVRQLLTVNSPPLHQPIILSAP